MNITELLGKMEAGVWQYFAIPLLVFLGIYFSIRIGFVQFRKIPLMVKLLTRKSENTEGISAFQSFTLALAARVGVGSLAGIGAAIVIGGYGTIFWMWVIALFGAASAYVESTLAQVYKEKKDGLSYGGPAYYILHGLKLKPLAIIFAGVFILVYGLFFPMVQMNAITTGINTVKEFNKLIPTFIVMVCIAIIILGGAKSIAKVTEIVVPVMAIIFIGFGFFAMIANFTQLGDFFTTVFQEAFKPRAFVTGGIIITIQKGIQRGIFANEAGMGSGATAAAAAEVKYEVESGLSQTLSVLITSILIGTLTSFIIFSASPALNDDSFRNSILNGIELTQFAFEQHFGTLGKFFLLIALVMFAFSTILTACYYLDSNLKFITKNKVADIVFKLLILVSILLGGIWKADLIWTVTDLGVAVMASINAVVIFILFKDVKKISKKQIETLEQK